jgi:glycosyltransferase involved in cell wall biosynthesis
LCAKEHILLFYFSKTKMACQVSRQLSIIVPTLNEEKHLPFLLESIKRQSFGDYEVIVADAGSEDKTLEIARKYNCKIVKGGLPAEGRNSGAKIAEKELLLFLDAEAVLPENFLNKTLLEFRKRKLGIAGCGLQPITKNKTYGIMQDILYNWPARLLEGVFPYDSNFILVEKEIHKQIGGFDEGITLGEDHAYARKAAKITRFGFLKSSKLTISPRRFQNEGWLTIGAKYYFCNLYNIFFGDVRSNIFRYNLKKRKEKKQEPKTIGIIFDILKIPIYAICFMIGFATWLIIFLIFSPKLITAYFDKKKNRVL